MELVTVIYRLGEDGIECWKTCNGYYLAVTSDMIVHLEQTLKQLLEEVCQH